MIDNELQTAIDECEKIAVESENVAFILSKDYKSEYRIVDMSSMYNTISQMPIYDSYFKELNKNRRFDKAYQLISELGFTPSTENLGMDYEQVFSKTILDYLIINIRLKSNLFCTISIYNEIIYNGYCDKGVMHTKISNFDYSKYGIDATTIVRDMKIDFINS